MAGSIPFSGIWVSALAAAAATRSFEACIFCARSRNAPLQIHIRVAIQEKVTQNKRQMWIHNRDRPFEVSTREDMDARVIDFGETLLSENLTWIGNRIGMVVHVCSNVNQTENDRLILANGRMGHETYNNHEENGCTKRRRYLVARLIYLQETWRPVWPTPRAIAGVMEGKDFCEASSVFTYSAARKTLTWPSTCLDIGWMAWLLFNMGRLNG